MGDVTQTYPDNFDKMLEDELKARDIYAKKQDSKWDDAMGEIEAYLSSHTRADTVKYADEHGIKISDKDRKLTKQESVKKEIRSKARANFQAKLKEWYNKTSKEERAKSGKRFSLGKTTDVLTSIGVKDTDIYFGASKINTIIEKKNQ